VAVTNTPTLNTFRISGIQSDLLNRAIDWDMKVLNHVRLTLASVGQIVGNYLRWCKLLDISLEK
jgi:hypothetical protein